MKIKLTLMAMAAGAMALVATNASAFPLTLKACSGVINATTSTTYSPIADTNKTHFVTRSFNLKTVLNLVSNTLAFYGSNTPPAGSYIVYNPYLNDYVYITNKNGYFQDLSSNGLGNHNVYVVMRLEDLAAAFKTTDTSIGENDSAIIYFAFKLVDADGNLYYASANYGIGSLTYANNSKKATMTVSGNGPDEGTYKSSYDGTSRLTCVFSGSTTPDNVEWEGTFWAWWED